MKTKMAFTLAGMVLMVLAGCVPVSLHPFYKDTDLVSEPGLVGVWGEKEGDLDYWAFSKGTNQNYQLEIAENGKSALFDAHVFKLGTNLFLDIFPDEVSFKKSKLSDTYAIHIVGVHSLALVTVDRTTLKLAFLKQEWLEKYLGKNPSALRHEITKDQRLILTASTRELQEFVLRHLDEAFDRESEGLKRLADAL